MASYSKQLKELLAAKPKYRQAQIEKAWFDLSINSYEEITTLPVELRQKFKDVPWMSLELGTDLTSKLDNTRKVLFKLHDGNFIEAVIMGRKNLKESATADSPARYTICISSQAGCPMRCAFCATGKAGFKRHLSAEEIIDQYRFCQRELSKIGARVNNIVLMGQGEPLLNYDNVKQALNVIIKNSDVGPTKITLSTVGYVPAMEQMITDVDFPPVRFALSLHSAIEETRKQIIPSNKKGFLEWLVKWAGQYQTKFSTRTHFIGFEYIMLSGVNDDQKHLDALVKLCHRLPHVRANLIPYNSTADKDEISEQNKLHELLGSNFRVFERTPHEIIEHWHQTLMKAGITSTIRYSQGQDIAAACGQLRNKVK